MSGFRYSYALNQWRQSPTSFVRLEDHERAFKTLSVSGFRAVELWAGTGRWSNLGRPEHLRLNYGSSAGFVGRLAECGIDAVSSLTWDPSAPAAEEGFDLRSTSRPADHARILAAVDPYLDLLTELGCDRIVVRATEPAGRIGADLDVGAVASVLERIGSAAKDRGVRLAADIDCLSPLRDAAGIASLLDSTDPDLVDLSLSTADLVVAGEDPVAIARRHVDRIGHVHLKDSHFVDSENAYLLPGAEVDMLQGNAGRRIERWFFEFGSEAGLVDAAAVLGVLGESDYSGWVVLESDQSPEPATSAMLNAWYLTHIAAAGFRAAARTEEPAR
ncbi:sugar phosphate isomerase/epimerase family protein [Amnibacterium flavum]|uniref:Sugar phosphate isomerase n=1 Tax=Amnibacterium flavum TaxID=2173173 RepID=A0A2V1HT00_9MICO|nr:sugar phosphate isomerase/epimerase [Amnibacterium flavum]PVZ95736.1 sugar phosphate isomerase [Amnibacterium flavum]